MKYRTAVPLGQGATGEVVKAWDPELERDVALKFLKSDAPELVARMRREARLQAKVRHPNVAQVHEVGELGGRSFIAMQLVEGRPLDEAAAELPLEQRVRLLAQVADAVHAAHREGLIHRDLKPGNVLVEERDGELVPFVLDFGIAREQEVAGETITGQVLGTPGYMSPEQARGEVHGLDRRSDVFALGVVLYELVTGARPFEADSAVEVLVQILGHDPSPPRTRVPGLPRDLETIVMTCLEKEPERRYPTAKALAADLRRFLDGEPIEARPVGAWGRLRRRARRHPIVTAVVGVAAAAVLASAVLLVAGAFKYTRDLERERNAAVAAREEAEEVASFLAGLFESASPYEDAAELTAREILTRGAERIGSELAGRPALQARMQHTVGLVQRELGLYDEADQQVRAALETRSALLGARHPDTARSRYELGRVRKEQGDYAEAIAHHLAALDALEASPDTAPEEIAAVVTALAAAAQETNDRDHDPGALYQRALQLYREAGLERSSRAAQVKNNLALVTSGADSRERAGALFQEALDDFTRNHGPDHPDVAQVLHNYGSFLQRRDLERAIPMLERALEIRRKAWGEGHPNVAYSTLNLGVTLSIAGHWRAAGELFERSVELARGAGLPADHLFFAAADFDILEARFRLGEGADLSRERVLQARDHALAATSSEMLYTVQPLMQWGWMELRRGRPASAEPALRHAVEMAREHIPQSPFWRIPELYRGIALRQLGRVEEGCEVLARLRGETPDGEGAVRLAFVIVLRELALCGLAAGEESLASEALAEIPDFEAETPAERVVAASTLVARASLAAARSRGDEARSLAAEALRVLDPVMVDDEDLSRDLAYAGALLLLGREAQAAPHLERLRRGGWAAPELLAGSV